MQGTECNGESCCEKSAVSGGTFPMGRGSGSDASTSGEVDEEPEHDVTVESFTLDKYEVTVGRFRKFVEALPCSRPAVDAGQHPKLPGSGWDKSWDAYLPKNLSAWGLSCDPQHQTWTDTPADNEQLPMSCVSWYQAFAFCAWDGGRLPTEAEWEYAAAGGSNNQLYPWGSNTPAPTYAVYLSSKVEPVGSKPTGKGPYGSADLAGSMWEWVLDWYSPTWYSNQPDAGQMVANVNDGTNRVVRGGSWVQGVDDLRAARRGDLGDPTGHSNEHGFRCVR